MFLILFSSVSCAQAWSETNSFDPADPWQRAAAHNPSSPPSSLLNQPPGSSAALLPPTLNAPHLLVSPAGLGMHAYSRSCSPPSVGPHAHVARVTNVIGRLKGDDSLKQQSGVA